jgi:signal transduction histidine kinase
MTATTERAAGSASSAPLPGRLMRSGLALLGAAAAVAAAVVGRDGGLGSVLGWLMLGLVWGLAAAFEVRTARTQAGRADRARVQVVALLFALAIEVVVVASILHVLVGWPPRLLQIAAAVTLPALAAFVVRIPGSVEAVAARAVTPAISVAGLTSLVAAVYLLVVVGLGRPPTHDERTALVLSIVAGGVSALLFSPVRRRLSRISNVLAGERPSPDELARTFRASLSRAVPLDELLLQLAESLRRAFVLEAAELWTRSDGRLERVASDPDRGPGSLPLDESEASVLATSGVVGPGRLAVWLPELIDRRGNADIRVAPVVHAGELFGLIVAERRPGESLFDEADDAVLAELASQIGLVLRNVRLDSQLQSSLDELRRYADELRVSRARVVAAADAERRRIERDLHDGAQQYLVGLAATLGAVRRLTDSDPARAKVVLDQLQRSVQEAMEAFRDLAHGIYPPLLEAGGLDSALSNAAVHAAIQMRVDVREPRRYDPDVEAAVYFCCLESIQNVAKHAGEGAKATIRVWEQEGALVFEVADDGVGLDPGGSGRGAGMANMQDRLAGVGGTVRVESPAGGGTKVVGAIPLSAIRARRGRGAPP